MFKHTIEYSSDTILVEKSDIRWGGGMLYDKNHIHRCGTAGRKYEITQARMGDSSFQRALDGKFLLFPPHLLCEQSFKL